MRKGACVWEGIPAIAGGSFLTSTLRQAYIAKVEFIRMLPRPLVAQGDCAVRRKYKVIELITVPA